MEQKLVLGYEYHDIDIVELRVAAWNGGFGGTTKLYVSQGELSQLASTLSGFPTSQDDTREITLGAFGANFAGGATHIRLRCVDGAGHTQVEVKMEEATWHDVTPEAVYLVARFEPAALDRFVAEMTKLSTTLRGEAELPFTLA